MTDAEFCAALHAAFGRMLGAFRAPTPRRLYPLALKYARQAAAPRTVLVGNAAQTLHPVAGQGFNLGLRDAWELARALGDGDDPGSRASLDAYFTRRRFDRTATILFTDSLIRLFSKDIPLSGSLRGLGLSALSSLPPLKRGLARRMMFGARG
jgi:2-octaprenyl-6-methoxyphenol hydroxylase